MNLLVNVDKNWAIGNDGDQLVYLKEDLQRFKQMTTGKVVVLGRETLSTFPDGKPLKDRVNIILTRDPDYTCEEALIAHSLEELFKQLEQYRDEDIYIIGGESVYQQLLPYVKNAFVTKINTENQADKYFPNLDKLKEWVLVEECEPIEEGSIAYCYNHYINQRI